MGDWRYYVCVATAGDIDDDRHAGGQREQNDSNNPRAAVPHLDAGRGCRVIITIDGPAGTGKSTVARAVAERLDYDFLDTGAMYRAVGLAALRRGTPLDDTRELAFIARHARIRYDFTRMPPQVFLNDEPVGHLLRGSDATRAASSVAVVPAIREMLVAQQQEIGRARPNLVTEGRDQGTVVFPEAAFKFYLDATSQERARRRATQLRARGETVDLLELLREIETRDRRDATRAVGPLAIPADAEVIDTSNLAELQVVEQIIERVRIRPGEPQQAEAAQ